ncbi:MAG: SAM-dependent methyltransferase [Nocardioides sp.]|uniref:THUMP-like domain-containing protein n=1 Tax=Nocardioides sp. TaxID=35761 RepID=UPI0039E252F4
MELDAFSWLLTPEGQALLERAEELIGSQTDTLRAHDLLRRDAPSAHVAAALTQAELRRRAVSKFGELAARMYFTPDGLEQATRLPVARHRAARLAAYGAPSLIDLGCGIGGDLIAAAEAGITAAGVDLDPERVAVAGANLATLGLPGAVTVADATAVDHTGFAVAYADPARRGAGGRVFSADDWAPPWSFVETLLRRVACVKVAPGIPHELVPPGVEAEWVSDHGEVKEAALWSGGLATTARRATVIGDGGLATLTDADAPPAAELGPAGLGDYLYEPDGAVIRAGLVTGVAASLDGVLLDEHLAYVGTDTAARTPYATGYRVVDRLPYREKQLRAALRERDIGALTIKKRGVDVVPEQLRKRLALRGSRAATIVLTRVDGQGTCLLVERIDRTT